MGNSSSDASGGGPPEISAKLTTKSHLAALDIIEERSSGTPSTLPALTVLSVVHSACWNEHFLPLTGKNSDDIVGKPVVTALGREAAALVAEVWRCNDDVSVCFAASSASPASSPQAVLSPSGVSRHFDPATTPLSAKPASLASVSPREEGTASATETPALTLSASTSAAHTTGSRSSATTIAFSHQQQQPKGMVVAVVQANHQGCCAQTVRRVWLLLEHQAASEKVLSRSLGSPLLFHCRTCDRFSTDSRTYVSYVDLVRRAVTKTTNFRLLHRTAVQPCSQCSLRQKARTMTSNASVADTLGGLRGSGSGYGPARGTSSSLGGGEYNEGGGDSLSAGSSVVEKHIRLNRTRVAIVVQPNEQSRAKIKRAVQSVGFSVNCFERAEGALEFLNCDSNYCDLLVSDVILPGMPGTKFMQQATRKRGPGLPIIAFAGSTAFSGAAVAAGAKVFLLRDCSDLELRRALYNHATCATSA